MHDTGTSSTRFLLWACFCLHDTGAKFHTSTNHTVRVHPGSCTSWNDMTRTGTTLHIHPL